MILFCSNRLNEGFATYLSYDGVKKAEPDWDTESMFLTGDLHRVLDHDATISSHAIVVDVDTPDQINSVFDIISYSKGSSVIRMMENFMGTDDFKKGITDFLNKFAYKNAVTQDLFDSLTASSSDKLDINKVTLIFIFPKLNTR
jgi:aminopeptidase N